MTCGERRRRLVPKLAGATGIQKEFIAARQAGTQRLGNRHQGAEYNGAATKTNSRMKSGIFKS